MRRHYKNLLCFTNTWLRFEVLGKNWGENPFMNKARSMLNLIFSREVKGSISLPPSACC
jgi:hypothetical protein